jgi:hypothetical protein
MKTLITRSQYTNALPKYGTEESLAHHRAYYAQFVTEETKEIVRRYIGEDKIRASKDRHFNDIPLAKWDALACGGLPRAIAFKDVGDFSSLAGEVCIAKEAAQQIRES